MLNGLVWLQKMFYLRIIVNIIKHLLGENAEIFRALFQLFGYW